MSVLIAMAVHNTDENQRFLTTRECINSLMPEYMRGKHHMIVVDNGSTCQRTKRYLDRLSKMYANDFGLITLEENKGTAHAINLAWQFRQHDHYAIKMDNDVVVRATRWIDLMQEAMQRDMNLGILGLKRKDCWEHPKHENPDLRSELIMLPKNGGERWIVVEKAFHVMGTCQMYSPGLLKRIGYLWQPSLYGYDDVLAAHRCVAVGKYSAFLPHIEIDHIDPGDTPYQTWKERHASEVTQQVIQIAAEYRTGVRSVYYNPFE
jgi:GT2 family glycosyltransferase